MNRLLVFILFFFSSLHPVRSQTKQSSILWEISGNGLSNPSYLFGTFHMMCKGDFAISQKLENILKTTTQFYGELKMDDPDMQTKIMAKMMMQGKTLQSMIPEIEYSEISNQFQLITGMPLIALNNFKPFFPLSLLALKSIPCKETVQPETEFVAIAKKNQMPILGLETIDDQMNAIDTEPLDSQVNSLKKTVKNFDSIKTEMAQMAAVYQLHDVDSLYSFMKKAGIEGNFENEMLNKRNHKWAPLISSIVQMKPSFFAVGAGHLGGPEGVISLLRKQGYTLKPILP